MLSSGFHNAAVSRFLVFSVVASSILVSITDVKHLFPVHVVPHLWRYKQLWRVVTYQTCYTSSTELLFAALTLYHMRVIERLWGSRKHASFLLAALPYTSLLPPLFLALVLRPLSAGRLSYLPAGPTALIFALLAQYHAAIPTVYKWRVILGGQAAGGDEVRAVTFTDKSTTYLLAAQLALSQFPHSIVGAAVGWIVGYAWRRDILPGGAARWRVPGWLLGLPSSSREAQGGDAAGDGEGYDSLRRRLEGEARASGADREGSGRARDGAPAVPRRTLGTQMLDQFRGAF
ncbi:MAG: hypothetical protein M1832_003300 [Thelocarpon impressellum]|nr:MAG: hypothetical protein M1832_003300 [Thelocarpon impressellum]